MREFNDPTWLARSVKEQHIDEFGTNFSSGIWDKPNGDSNPREISFVDFYNHRSPQLLQGKGGLLQGLTPA